MGANLSLQVQLSDIVTCMGEFPGGGWDLESDFEDVTTWLTPLRPFSSSTRVQRVMFDITQLSGNIQQLAMSSAVSDGEDDKEDEFVVPVKVEKGAEVPVKVCFLWR